MTRRSTVTGRDTPVHGASTASGGMVVRADTLTIPTTERVQLVDLTDRLMTVVRESGVREGVVSLWSMHTTCALFINETQLALHADIRRFLDEIVSRDTKWLHNDPEHSDCDRMNADAHLRAMLLGHSLTLQVTLGEPVLGHWQRVLMAELDGPRERTVRVQILGMR
jgi:secondary thiamine-phosphate synthase enzyme